MPCKPIMTAVIVLLVGAAAVPSMANANVHGCHVPSAMANGEQAPRNHPELIGKLSVRNMSCQKALHAIDISVLLPNGDIRTPRFGCHMLKTYRSFGTVLGADIRCAHRRPSNSFRFLWGT
jgi:hypothetical protein